MGRKWWQGGTVKLPSTRQKQPGLANEALIFSSPRTKHFLRTETLHPPHNRMGWDPSSSFGGGKFHSASGFPFATSPFITWKVHTTGEALKLCHHSQCACVCVLCGCVDAIPTKRRYWEMACRHLLSARPSAWVGRANPPETFASFGLLW